VAVSMIDGPETALARVGDWSSDRRLREYHLYHAVRADLLRRSGDRAAAAEAYRAAIERSVDPAERRYLQRRLTGLGLPTQPGEGHATPRAVGGPTVSNSPGSETPAGGSGPG